MRGEMERVSSETEIERVMMGLALSTSGTASQSPSPVPVLDLGAALGGDVGHVDLGVVAGADADLVRVALKKRLSQLELPSFGPPLGSRPVSPTTRETMQRAAAECLAEAEGEAERTHALQDTYYGPDLGDQVEAGIARALQLAANAEVLLDLVDDDEPSFKWRSRSPSPQGGAGAHVRLPLWGDERRGRAARAAYLRGRALDGRSVWSREAEEALGRALKLCPEEARYWGALGDCFLKKRDLRGARFFCMGAVEREPRGPAHLRRLALVEKAMAQAGVGSDGMRRQAAAAAAAGGGPAANESGAVLSARELAASAAANAKAAVAADVEDGASWACLAGCCMLLYFTGDEVSSRGMLAQALAAFSRAVDKGCAGDPDVHFNRGVAQRFAQDWAACLSSFQKAAALDRKLPAADEVERTEALLLRLSHLCAARGGLKPKRVEEFVRPMRAREDAGTRPPAAPAAVTDTCRTLEALLLRAGAADKDTACLACCRVVCAAPNPVGGVPLFFVCVDADARAFVLAAYCLADGAVRDGALLAILGPQVARVELSLDGPAGPKRASFVSLRVDGPSQLALVGQHVTLAADGRAHASAAPRLATHTL